MPREERLRCNFRFVSACSISFLVYLLRSRYFRTLCDLREKLSDPAHRHNVSKLRSTSVCAISAKFKETGFGKPSVEALPAYRRIACKREGLRSRLLSARGWPRFLRRLCAGWICRELQLSCMRGSRRSRWGADGMGGWPVCGR